MVFGLNKFVKITRPLMEVVTFMSRKNLLRNSNDIKIGVLFKECLRICGLCLLAYPLSVLSSYKCLNALLREDAAVRRKKQLISKIYRAKRTNITEKEKR